MSLAACKHPSGLSPTRLQLLTPPASNRCPRVKHKQEVQSLRSELAKLQSESKMGIKGKETAQKDVDALKKKVGRRIRCRWFP